MPEPARKLDRETRLRLDLLLMPLTLMLYLLAWLDRANVGNARVAGMADDLPLSDWEYKTAITVTYVPYIVAELPSNLLLKKIGPRFLLPTLCILWGLVTTLQCKVTSFSGFVACRFFLGMLEGGLFPGIVLYLSGFYQRHELQVRIALFFSAASLSGAFSGLLAAAIVKMDGLRGLRGWQWIFLLEGAFTMLFGLIAMTLLPNEPNDVITFRAHHIESCISRLERDSVRSGTAEDDKVTVKKVASTLLDVHVWLSCAALFCSGCCLFGLAYFSPSIVQALGYGTIKTQLLTVPPYACAFVVTLIVAFAADHYKQRGISAILTSLLALTGAAMALKGRSIGLRYTALILIVTGIYSCAPCLISWIPNNSAGHVRRATAVAMGFISTSIGAVMSTWIYPANSAPYYELGARFNLALIVIMIALVAGQVFWLRRMNEVKRGRPEEVLRGLEGLSYEEQFALLGDKHPAYLYTY
ncbi:major facilitator superfamily domain-containing protein [Aspergillus germanicus]